MFPLGLLALADALGVGDEPGEPGVAEPRRAGDRLLAPAPDPERRPGLLDARRERLPVLDRDEWALEIDRPVGREEGVEKAQALDQPAGALLHGDAEGPELRRDVAERHAERHAAARELIHHGGPLGDVERVVQGQDQDGRDEVEVVRGGGEAGEPRQRGGPVVVALAHLVVVDPAGVESDLLGQPDALDDAVPRPALLRKEPDFHATVYRGSPHTGSGGSDGRRRRLPPARFRPPSDPPRQHLRVMGGEL